MCCVTAAGYIDVDCGLREDDVPSVMEIMESPACCSVDCDDDDDDDGDFNCPPIGDRCAQVALSTINATYNATCRFLLSTVILTLMIAYRPK